MLWNLFELLVNLFQCTIIIQTLTKYLGGKYDGWKGRAWAAAAILLVFTEMTYVNNKIAFEGVVIVIPILIIFMYALVALRGTWKKKLFFSFMIMVMVIGVTAALMNIMGLIFGKTYMQLVIQQNAQRFVTVIMIQVVIFYVSRILLMRKNLEDSLTSWKVWTVIITVPCVSVIVLALIMELSLKVRSEYSELSVQIAAVTSMGIFLMDLLTYYIYIRLEKDAAEKMEYEILKHRYMMQESNMEDLKSLYSNLQKTKHDVKHHINLLKMLLDQNEIDEAVRYLEQYADTMNTSEKNKIFCENIMINYIVNSKIQVMENKNIKFFCDIYGGIKGVSDVDLNIVLGNLLDNAIEACDRSNMKEREITLSLRKKLDYLIIKVKNTYDREPEEMMQKSTSKEDKENHGFGLQSVEDVLEKYHGYLDMTYENHVVELKCVLELMTKQDGKTTE